jgi:hypothetical protein
MGYYTDIFFNTGRAGPGRIFQVNTVNKKSVTVIFKFTVTVNRKIILQFMAMPTLLP